MCLSSFAHHEASVCWVTPYTPFSNSRVGSVMHQPPTPAWSPLQTRLLIDVPCLLLWQGGPS